MEFQSNLYSLLTTKKNIKIKKPKLNKLKEPVTLHVFAVPPPS